MEDGSGVADTKKPLFESSWLFSEALVISGVTAVGFWVAYWLEKSYLSYFGIPDTFVSISFSHSIGRIAALLAFVGGVYVFLVWIGKTGRLHLRWAALLIMSTFFAFPFWLYVDSLLWKIFFSIPVIVIATVMYAIPLILYGRGFNRFVKANTDTFTDLKLVPEGLPLGFYMIMGFFSIFALSVPFCKVVGYFVATQQSEFATINNRWLVVDIDDQLLLAGYDAEARKLTGKIRIMNRADAATVTFETRQLAWIHESSFGPPETTAPKN